MNPALPDYESLLASIAHRRSMGLSSLSPEPVQSKYIEAMLQAADWAPSHGDTEPWRFRVFAGDSREQLAELYGDAYRSGVSEDEFQEEKYQANRARAFAAPVWISIAMVPGREADGSLTMTIEEELMATACSVQNLHLMASTIGLAGMWHSKGLSVHPAVAKGLGIEAPSRLLGFFFCGWPCKEWTSGERRPLDEKVSWA